MFSGIIESVQPILSVTPLQGAVRITVARPSEFQDLKTGDSIANDGVCLTLEAFTDQTLQFVLASETLKVLQWPAPENLRGRRLNLERSLRYGDRIHGHLVSGHVDSLAEVLSSEAKGDSWFLTVRVAPEVVPFLWKKGSITLAGVSLTINELTDRDVQVCLIPETQKRTNLCEFKPGQRMNVEPDWMAKAMTQALQNQLAARDGGI